MLSISDNQSNIRLRRRNLFYCFRISLQLGCVVGQVICIPLNCLVAARYGERCGAGSQTIFGVSYPDSAVRNHRSQIPWIWQCGQPSTRRLPGPTAARPTFHYGLGRGTGAGCGRGVGAGLGITVGVGVAVEVAVGVEVGLGVAVAVGVGVGVGAIGTIAYA